MLEMRELPDIKKYSEIINSLPDKNADYKVIESFGKAKMITGFAVYSYEEDAVVIHHCEYGEDIELCDGILRTVLFKAIFKGIDRGICLACEDKTNLFDKMRYPQNDGHEIASINNFLNSCKKCKEIS